jgi:hypothetical protein
MPSAKDILAYLTSKSYSDPKDRGIKPFIKSRKISLNKGSPASAGRVVDYIRGLKLAQKYYPIAQGVTESNIYKRIH